MSAEQAEWLRNEMRSAQNMSARYKLGSKDREAWSAKAEKFRDAAAHIESLETRIEAQDATIAEAAERYLAFRELLTAAMDSSPAGETAEGFISRLTDAMETAADAFDAAREATR